MNYLLREWKDEGIRERRVSGHTRSPLEITNHEFAMESVCMIFEIFWPHSAGQTQSRGNVGFNYRLKFC